MAPAKSPAVASRPALRLLPAVVGGGTADHAVGVINPAGFAPPAEQSADAAGRAALMPGEEVLLLTVALPAMTAAQRRATVAYAIEDRIAQPLELVHVVLGPQVPGAHDPGLWLVAVVSHAAMSTRLATALPASVPLVPDVLTLPVPMAGAWSVLAQASRVLVRLPDTTGFATTAALLPVFWAAAGRPQMIPYGGTLPGGIPVAAQAVLPAAGVPLPSGFDLRTGRYSPRGAGVPRGARALAAVLALALAGHLALLALDVSGLGRIVAQREAALRQALGTAAQPVAGDLDAALASALAARMPALAGGFLPLLAQAFAAIGAQSGSVTVKTLRYAPDSLSLTLEAPDLAALQAVQNAFEAAGLAVAAGPATSANGAAEAQMTLRRAAP